MSVSRTIAAFTSASNLSEYVATSYLKDVKVHQGETFVLKQSSLNKRTDSVELLNGVNWYDYMILHDDVMALMDEFSYDKLCSMFVVCCTLPWKDGKVRRKYAAFPDIPTFLKYISMFPHEQWYFFEIIMGEHKQKLYFDIDLSKEKIPKDESLETFSNKLVNSLVSAIVNCLAKYEIVVQPEKDLLIFSSNAAHKYSYHVILNNYYVMNNQCNTILCTEIKELMPAIFNDFIDEAVYSAKQQLRLFKSQKPGSGRIKELVKSYFYGISEIFSPTDSFENIFLHSCITYVENCQIIPVYATINKSLLVPNEGSQLTEQDIKDIRTVVNPVVFQIYELTKVVGRMLLLKRRLKAHCSLCSRIHDNENGFLTVANDWNIYFHCRRNQTRSLYVGFLKDNSESRKIEERQLELMKKRIETQQQIQNTIPDASAIPKSPPTQETKQAPDKSINLLSFANTYSGNIGNASYFQYKNNDIFDNLPKATPNVLEKKTKHQLLREMSATAVTK